MGISGQVHWYFWSNAQRWVRMLGVAPGGFEGEDFRAGLGRRREVPAGEGASRAAHLSELLKY